MMNVYIGLPSKELFQFVLSLVNEKSIHKCSSLSDEDHFILVLMKLKLGLYLAYRFHLQASTVSRIYKKWISSLAEVLQFLIV